MNNNVEKTKFSSGVFDISKAQIEIDKNVIRTHGEEILYKRIKKRMSPQAKHKLFYKGELTSIRVYVEDLKKQIAQEDSQEKSN